MSISVSKTSSGLAKQTLTGFKWAYISIVLQAVLQIVVLATLAHLLSPKAFGLVSMALILTNFAERVGQLGVGPAVVQREIITDTHISAAFLISIITGVLIFSSLCAVSNIVANFFGEPELRNIVIVISAIFLLDGFSNVPEGLLQRQLRFRALLVVDNVSYLIGQGIVAISLAFLGFGAWALVGGIVAGRFVKMLILLYLVPQQIKLRLPMQESKELVNVGVGFSLGRLLNFAAIQGDNFVVGRILGASVLGSYTRAYQLMVLPANYFGQVLDRVLFPAMAKRQSEKDSLKRVFINGIEAVAFVALPMSVFIYLCAEEIVTVLFGKQWSAVIPVLQILSIGIFFRTAYKNCDTLTRALGAVYKHAVRQAIYAAIVIAGSIVGCRWGLEGVAVAVLFSVTVNYVLMVVLSLQLLQLPMKTFLRAHLPSIWASIFLILLLAPSLHFLRTEFASAFLRLMMACVEAGLIMILASRFAPRQCRLHLIPSVLIHVDFKRWGTCRTSCRELPDELGLAGQTIKRAFIAAKSVLSDSVNALVTGLVMTVSYIP